ncbi:MAG TPA: hypothetical protein VGE52_01915 [Pirellulales bacterium]
MSASVVLPSAINALIGPTACPLNAVMSDLKIKWRSRLLRLLSPFRTTLIARTVVGLIVGHVVGSLSALSTGYSLDSLPARVIYLNAVMPCFIVGMMVGANEEFRLKLESGEENLQFTTRELFSWVWLAAMWLAALRMYLSLPSYNRYDY